MSTSTVFYILLLETVQNCGRRRGYPCIGGYWPHSFSA